MRDNRNSELPGALYLVGLAKLGSKSKKKCINGHSFICYIFFLLGIILTVALIFALNFRVLLQLCSRTGNPARKKLGEGCVALPPILLSQT